jgi:hypothetical protein
MDINETFSPLNELIEQQTNVNACLAIEIVILGHDTPLLDSNNLRGHVSLIQAQTRKFGLEACLERIKKQIRACNIANGKNEYVCGEGNLSGVRYEKVDHHPATVEQVQEILATL